MSLLTAPTFLDRKLKTHQNLMLRISAAPFGALPAGQKRRWDEFIVTVEVYDTVRDRVIASASAPFLSDALSELNRRSGDWS